MSIGEMESLKCKLHEQGARVSVFQLNQLLPVHAQNKTEKAQVLVIKNGVSFLLQHEDAESKVLGELERMPKDSTTLMYGRVVNKHARHNNTIGDFDQAPEIAKGKGTVVNLKDYPYMNQMRCAATKLVGSPTQLVGELNDYFDANLCGIGWHGDLERKYVVGMRMGPGAKGMPLKYQWFHESRAVGDELQIILDAGDIYIMSQKAVGFDWKHSSKYTLRHAAGKSTCAYAKTKRPRDDKAHVVKKWIPGVSGAEF